MAAKTKPVSVRNLQLSPRADMVRRLTFLVCIASAIGGPALTILGIKRNNMTLWLPGIGVIAVAIILFLLRNKLQLKQSVDEIASNPFKTDRTPKE